MVTVPEARRSSPAAAVSWQQSCQPGSDRSSGPSPLSIRSCSWPTWVTTPASCCRWLNHYWPGWDESNGDHY